jgi:hypothetical protein
MLSQPAPDVRNCPAPIGCFVIALECAISFPLAATPEMLYHTAHEQIRAKIALAGVVPAVGRIGAD